MTIMLIGSPLALPEQCYCQDAKRFSSSRKPLLRIKPGQQERWLPRTKPEDETAAPAQLADVREL